jgi:photosystem II stability/assembly factor-like uncharacterized protein
MSRSKFIVAAGLCALGVSALASVPFAQAPPAPTSESLFGDLRWRNIGPANMAGRISDIEAVEANPAIVYVGSASGGVWKSENAGTTWTPIFENYPVASIGDIAIFQPNPEIIWVGTGEDCVRNSVSWGDGVYKSTDGGKTFVNVGLPESHHIGKVITHPTNPDIAYVAAQGHLWDFNPERGVYRTTDGGKTWQKLTNGLPTDDKTGASDIMMDPSNPDILYAGLWQRLRRPYIFESGSANGGIYKSTNGGNSWTKLTAGLPTGNIGKVGLTIHRNNPRILSAIVEAASSDDLATPGSGIYRSEDAGATWTYVNNQNSRPFYYSHIQLDPNDPNRLYYMVVPARVSDDGGRTFNRNLTGIEGDFHAMWIDPANSKRFYIGNDKGASVTYDEGHSFIMFDNMDIGQYYAITLDNRDPYYIYGGLQDSGNWGGPSNSRDYNGILTDHWWKFHSGDGFHTTVDPDDWTTVFTETQNGNVRRLDADFRQTGTGVTPRGQNILNLDEVTAREGEEPSFRYNWSSPLILSPHNSRTLYLGGNYLMRSTDRGESWSIISPDLSTKDPDYTTRGTPAGFLGERGGAETHATMVSVVESSLRPGVIWVGTDDGNVQLTRDGGTTWANVRDNLPTSDVPARTWVSRVEPSHFDAATAYVSFDGHRNANFRPYIYKTTDYGQTWTNVMANLPAKGPVYVVKEDLRNPSLLFAGTEYGVFASIDGGGSWHRMMSDMPTVAVHDLVIHPRDNDLVAATHGRSLWILDDITPLQQLTPAVLAGGAHAFSNRVTTMWKAVSRGATRGHLMFQGRNPLSMSQREPQNSPSEIQNSATVSFYVGRVPSDPATIEITETDGDRTFTAEIEVQQGINRYFWPLSFAQPNAGGGRGRQGAAGGAARGGGRQGAAGQQAAAGRGRQGAAGAGGGRGGGGRGGGANNAAGPGTYRVKLTIGGEVVNSTIVVRPDPNALRVQ